MRQAFYRITCGAAKRVIKKCSPRFSESIAERSLFIFSQPVQRNADRSFCLYWICLLRLTLNMICNSVGKDSYKRQSYSTENSGDCKDL